MNNFTKDDIKYMKLAIKLAEKGRGKTNPNPMVGAVIVKNGKIISKGFHKKAGLDHAEVEAINNCKEPLSGSTMYVTLEPCAIHGKTPPCVNEIIKYKFRELVIGCIDPNPLISRKGIEFLKKSKIRVRYGLLKDEIKVQNEVFFKHIKKKIPFVCAKIAASIDGKLATKTGDSKWITSQKSREKVQNLRKEYGCILTGINTVLLDNPYLFPRKKNIDIIENIYKNNNKFYRIILDSMLKIKPDSNIVKTSSFIKTIVFTSYENKLDLKDKIKELERKNIDILFAENIFDANEKTKKLNLIKILKTLYDDYNITSILLECGPTLLTSFLKNKLIDKFIIFLAPKIVGGDSIYNMFLNLNIEKMKNSLKINYYDVKKLKDDIVISAYPDY